MRKRLKLKSAAGSSAAPCLRRARMNSRISAIFRGSLLQPYTHESPASALTTGSVERIAGSFSLASASATSFEVQGHHKCP